MASSCSFTQSKFALIHISPETRIITRLWSLIGHGRHQISFLLANLQNSFNSKCNSDWLRLIKVKLFKMLTLHSLLSHLTWLPLRPFLSANKIGHLSAVNQSDCSNSWDGAPVSTSHGVTPPCHVTPRPCVTHHMSRGPGCRELWQWPHWSPCDDSDLWLAENILWRGSGLRMVTWGQS